MSEKRYFAASNTERGFLSYFSEIFRKRAERCYIIKGGPGTGKSRLMREMGVAAESAGYGVEYYYCSSDPDSLDGIFAERSGESFAVLDGTAPHSEDLITPGSVDNIIDLGRFWNSGILRERRHEIGILGEQKKNAYAAAYRALSAYGAMTRSADALVRECVDINAITEECAKIAVNLKPIPQLRTPLCAIGMKGYRRFNTFSESARHTLCVTDGRGYGCSYLYFDALVHAVGACRTSPDPVFADRFTGILSDGVAVVAATVTEKGENAIDVADFVDRSAFLNRREHVERLRYLADGALDEATVSFAEAGAAHMGLEQIFTSAMNFGEKEAYSGELCAKIVRGDL